MKYPLSKASALGALSLVLACSEGTAPADALLEDDDANEKDDAGGEEAGGEEANADGADAGGEDPDLDLEVRQYLPDDPRIQYSGRIDFSQPNAPTYSAVGATVTARFRGDSILAGIDDLASRRNYYEVVIDGEVVKKLAPEGGRTRYLLADGLEPGEHTVVLAKRTEASVGKTVFRGFEVTGELLDPEPKPDRRIEFIGDSITAGAGIEAANGSAQCMEDSWGEPYHNNYLSYGPVAARALGAEWQVTAVSGIGLTINYSQQYDARPMSEVYELLYLEDEDSPEYDRSQFIPDVVVVALGTNDFSPGDDERPPLEVDPYIEAYIEFVERLRDYYPEAHLFCLSSPMLGDGWPDERYTSASDLLETIHSVEAHFSEAGDDRVHAFEVTKLAGRGCGTHPNVEQHALLGEELAEEIASVVGWE